MVDLMGPGQNAGGTTSRPADTRVFGDNDTYFTNCDASGANGTLILAGFLNCLTAQVRAVLRGGLTTFDNADDQMLLKAIEAIAANAAGDLTHYVLTDGSNATLGKTWAINISGRADQATNVSGTGTVAAATGVFSSYVVCTTSLTNGFALRAAADTTNTNAILQFTNNAQNVQWSSITSTNGILNLNAATAVRINNKRAVSEDGDTYAINISGTANYAQNATGTLAQQVAKAWVNFDGTLGGTIAPRASYNVSSITKNGTGIYKLNFVTAQPDTNYIVVGSCGSGLDNSTVFFGAKASPTTTAFTFGTGNYAMLDTDYPYIHVVVFGH